MRGSVATLPRVVHASDSSLLSPAAGTSFPRHPQSLSLTHALEMASYNRGLSLSEPIKAKAGTGTGLSRTSCQQESSAPMRSYVPPTPLISERGIMTRCQDSSSVRWSRHPLLRLREGPDGNDAPLRKLQPDALLGKIGGWGCGAWTGGAGENKRAAKIIWQIF